ncbi:MULTISPECIES: type 4 pilus major pilin [Paraburkholderia]|uniref:type 4 pilus major pilin n=1 Tax=Paraburkholderia TaxID=1822464 RepID=UPI00038048CD|nr:MULTISPECIES: type 4 pilus major pilin [Paraburkholderia]MDH6146219.1 X-X-X-Leu-X-X-Gly heptad repeat protein [Paraburkholderia sp. WSM4179]
MQHQTTVVVSRAARRGRASRSAQRGASLLEAIAYLGIAAIVVIGAVALLNGAFTSAGTNELAEQVNAIQAGVKKLYMGQANGYTSISNSVLSSAGVFPSTIPVAPDGTATNTWGGSVAVTSPNTGTFKIEYQQVPQAVCINTVTAGGSWTSVQVNNGTATPPPMTPAAAQGECTSATANTIDWISS